MPTPRPLAFAVVLAIAAGLAAPDAIAQKKKAAAGLGATVGATGDGR